MSMKLAIMAITTWLLCIKSNSSCADGGVVLGCHGYSYDSGLGGYTWAGGQTNTCSQDQSGNTLSCSQITPNYATTQNYNVNYWYYWQNIFSNWDSQLRTMSGSYTVYIKCHSYCASCTGNGNTNCQTCVSNRYKWVRASTCHVYCPNAGVSSTYNTVGEYITSTSNPVCSSCDSKCTWCQQNAPADCYACMATSYLIDDYSECTTRFPSPQLYACYSRQCVASQCPDQFYYQVPRASMSSAPYSTWAAQATFSNFYNNGAQQYRLTTNVCYLCDSHCETCTGYQQTNCDYCSKYNYQWRQYNNNYCESYCPIGVFGAGWVGEFKDPLVDDIATGMGARYCSLCHANCVLCTLNSTHCFLCKNGIYLLDLNAECKARFTTGRTPTCTKCMDAAYNTCDNSTYTLDNQCISSCPEFMYFPTSKCTGGTTCTDSARYTTQNQLESVTYYNNQVNPRAWVTGEYYRKSNAMCKLCDYRCIKCTGPLNTDCTVCADNFYKWQDINGTAQTICDSACPDFQYIALDNATTWASISECNYCNSRCELCEYTSNNCTKCVAFYPVPVWTPAKLTGYLYAYNNSYSQCLAACPQSTDPGMTVGYYGSIVTMICYPCPSPCLDCDLSIITSNSMYLYLSCGGDPLCEIALQCSLCMTGYVLVAGRCIADQNCRDYAYYNESNLAAEWSAANCICLDGYSSSGTIVGKCDIKCHISCKTCSGTSSSNCLSCEDGFYLAGGSCTDNSTKSYVWTKPGALSFTGFSMSISASTAYANSSCGGYASVFGYENQPSSPTNTRGKQFGFTFSIPSTNYYAIHLKMEMIFIDEFSEDGSVLVSYTSNGSPVAAWGFDTQGAYGQLLCGDNRMDYVLMVNIQIPTRNLTSETLYVRTNEDTILDESGVNLHWGFRQVSVTMLKCHADCGLCSGPTANDCLTCSSNTKILINNTCICDVDNGYYYWPYIDNQTCHLGCDSTVVTDLYNKSTGWYADKTTRNCVKPENCPAPTYFANSTTSNGTCVSTCPGSLYASNTARKCLTTCGLISEYNYNGAIKSCEKICPGGLYRNPATFTCVQKCPSSSYLEITNRLTDPYCTTTCTDWEYDGPQLCVSTCPSDTFKQVISGHNKCVASCVGATYFAYKANGTCVLSCPSPTYADPSTGQCVDTCSNPLHFMQISNIAATLGVRSCVPRCESLQYGNPFTKRCTSFALYCPDGYYADDNTNMCQPNCTLATKVAENSTRKCQSSCTTGFADRINRVCVSICSSDPEYFGNTATKQCVSSCDHAANNLYGDYQANRTCVTKCSSFPVSLFGHNSSSKCVSRCPDGQYSDPSDPYRRCVLSCSSSPQRYAYSVTKQCLLTCPDQYYANIDATVGGQCVQSCPNPLFADPVNNTCRAVCKYGWWGLPTGIRPCVQTCPYDWFAMNISTNRICVTACDPGWWGDLQTSMCYNNKSYCSNTTYADEAKALCVINTNCTEGTYADPYTKGCETSCSNGLLKDDNINTCVVMCSDDPDEYNSFGRCMANCESGRFADWQYNRGCRRQCSSLPVPTFGVVATHRCVEAFNCPSDFYADNVTRLCLDPCTGDFPFGDPVSKMCVFDCPDGYYGDIDTNLCVTVCDFSVDPKHYADNITGNCETLCTLGTFGVNSSAADPLPHCQVQCPEGQFARDSDRICVADCGPGLYGDSIKRKCYSDPNDCSEGYYANSVSHLCVLPANCQTVTTHYFADDDSKQCIVECVDPKYGDQDLWICVQVCPEGFFGENTTWLCLGSCSGYSSLAEDQNNLCVSRCSNVPVRHFADWPSFTCVVALSCGVDVNGDQTYARNASQECEALCQTGEWADPTTLMCVQKCPTGYYGDDSTGKRICVTSCPGDYRFRDPVSKTCVSICPIANNTFGDTPGDICVSTCPSGYFAQVDANRRCVSQCAASSWGNQVTRICITNPLTQCPGDTWADDFTHLCTDLCSSSQAYYGYNATKRCVTSCPSPTFAFEDTRVCIDICPVTLVDSGYFGDPDTTPTRKCYKTCQTAGLYRDPAQSRTCATSCTFNSAYKTYKDPTTMSCEAVCSRHPVLRYADDTLQSCETSCAGDLKKDDSTQKCVTTCPNLYDPTTDKCVDECPSYSTLGVLYADMSSFTCVVATSCPSSTYGDSDNNLCTGTCPNNTYIYGKECVYTCPNNYFFDNINRKCVIPDDCPTDMYADNRTLSCVTDCVSSFADVALRRCVDVCYGSKYGDPFTMKCETSCSNGLHINLNNNACEADCNNGTFQNPSNFSCSSTCPDPYYADLKLRACVTTCSSNPMTFSIVNSTGFRVCVQTCPTNKWHDMINRQCVDVCPTGTYSYSVNMSCVAFCPSPSHYKLGSACVTNCSTHATLKYADDISRTCVSTCPTGTLKNPLSYKCVETCPSAPEQYYSSVSENACTKTCPEGEYADPQQQICVSTCSLSPRTYAEDFYNLCVAVCPLSKAEFADPLLGKCATSCSSGYFADSRDRVCKQNCSYLYADSLTTPPSCVENCTATTFADELTFKCVGQCPPNYYAHTPTKRCLQFCPYGYFADKNAKKCVVASLCPAALPYADSLTHTCTANCSNGQWHYLATSTTSGGSCLDYCPDGYYSNPNTRKCVTGCPSGLFSQDDNNTCTDRCPYEMFMDSVNKKCVVQCPSANNLFGNLLTRKCVTGCDPADNTYADTLTRQCEPTCTGNQYADDSSQKCVGPTACPSNQFSDPFYKRCVDVCYNGTYGYQGKCIPDCPTATNSVYASENGRLCVTAMNCPAGTFGDPVLHKCVEFCPIESATFSYASTKKCVTGCPDPYYADNSTRKCVLKCPDVPELFGENNTNVCVENCPSGFAEQDTNMCAQFCPDGFFADSTTRRCVEVCPEGYFGNNITNQCVVTCPSSPAYYGDPESRMCILYCDEGKYADPNNNRECHQKCLGNYSLYAENSTNTCQATCDTGFANERTKQCIAVCTSGYYGYQKICRKTCPSASTAVYADDSTNLCKTACPDGTFADSTTKKCVETCPINESLFGNVWTKKCVSTCDLGEYADFSTRLCVERCPTSPALFSKMPERKCIKSCPFGLYADNQTRSCNSTCPDGTYADNTTMKCEFTCPLDPLMYGENITNKCVKKCSQDRVMFADNATGTCVHRCTNGTFSDDDSRTCVVTCPQGTFAENQTQKCLQFCPQDTFADSLLRVCVHTCSVDPVFYGDPHFWVCRPQCLTGSYGNPLTQQCVYNIAGVSDCPDGYFADPTTMLCVQVCPMIEDLYGDPNTKTCQVDCTGGLFADNSTMTCVDRCPDYPSYFADLEDMRCVPYCENGTFADTISRQCLEECPEFSYAENYTNRCVDLCPYYPMSFADDTTWQCVIVCPEGYFSDNSTMKCVDRCPEDENTFGYNGDNTCVRVCPLGTFADSDTRMCETECTLGKIGDNTSNRCVSGCSRYPPLYSDPTSGDCVGVCPPTYYAYEEDRVCLQECPPDFYREDSSRSCVQTCNYSDETYADNQTKNCESNCSVDSWANPIIRVCVAKCPDQPLMYADNSTQSCVSRCPGITYGDNDTRSCVNECPSGSLSLPQLNLCVRYCPTGYFAYGLTAFCLDRCIEPYYGDPSTRSCVEFCPISQLLYADNSSRQCVLGCPDGTFSDKKSITCVTECPDAVGLEAQTYAASYINACVEQCSLPYYADISQKKCVTICPAGYYNNIQDHICHPCRTECRSCSTYDVCTSCGVTLYLQMGSCVSTCSQGYYAKASTMTCVSSYSCKPLFGVNSTHVCQTNCPDGSYKNTAQYRCDACQATCLTCTSWGFCLSCTANSVMFSNFCWAHCSEDDTDGDSLPDLYFDKDNVTCTDTCPNGTYLSVVFCKLCDSICETCTGNSSNCTLCSGGLYLENMVCKSSCSAGYKPTADRECIYCGTNCGNSLTFDTNVTIIDGQSNIYLTFSDNITLNGDVYDIFALQQTSRRVLALGYRIEVVDDKTIRIIIENGADASKFEVFILTPENIQDSYGNLPASVRKTIKIDLSNIYTTTVDSAPAGVSTYISILAAICVVSFLFDLEMMKYLQLLHIHYFIAIILPPELSKVLIGMQWSTLNYIPTMYSVPDATLRETVPGKIYDVLGDFSFLRNGGFALTPLAVILVVWIVMKLLSVPEVNRFKRARMWCKDTLEEKFKYAVLIEWFSIIYPYTIFTIFLQMRDYHFYDSFTKASIFISLFLLFLFLLMVAFISYKVISFFIDYPKLSENLKKATDLILQEGEYHRLNSNNIFLFEMKKIDLRNILYPKVNNENILPFRMIYRFTFLALCCLPVTLIRATLLGCILALAYKSALLQMALCLTLNAACLLYFSRARPFSFKFKKRRIRNYMAIINEASLIIFEIMMLALAILDRDNKSSFEKENYSKAIIVFIALSATVNFLYFLFRVGVQVYRKIWMPFTESEIFRLNFPEKYAELHGAKDKKFLKGVDPKAKEALRALVKGYKKHRSELRPNQKQMNSQLPMKYKITYFDRDNSSIGSTSSMSKKQRRQMLKQLFQGEDPVQDQKMMENFEEVISEEERTEGEFEQYEEEIEIRAKDLAKYVKNGEELLRLKNMNDQERSL